MPNIVGIVGTVSLKVSLIQFRGVSRIKTKTNKRPRHVVHHQFVQNYKLYHARTPRNTIPSLLPLNLHSPHSRTPSSSPLSTSPRLNPHILLLPRTRLAILPYTKVRLSQNLQRLSPEVQLAGLERRIREDTIARLAQDRLDLEFSAFEEGTKTLIGEGRY